MARSSPFITRSEQPERGGAFLTRLPHNSSENGNQHSQEQYVSRRQGSQLRLRARAQSGDDDGELAASDQGGPCAPTSAAVHPSSPRRPVTRRNLSARSDDSQGHSQPYLKRQSRRVDLETKEEKECSVEQVSKRGQQPV